MLVGPARPAVPDSVDGQEVVVLLRVEGLHPKRLAVNRLKRAVLVVSVGARIVVRVDALAGHDARAGHDAQMVNSEDVRRRRRARAEAVRTG